VSSIAEKEAGQQQFLGDGRFWLPPMAQWVSSLESSSEGANRAPN